jgi:prepilin-type N-terminal cleavage/methylation domain-containing protein
MKFPQANALATSGISPGSRAVTTQRGVCAILAFTLMEVMIAIAVFCIGVFAILGLVASVMRGARLLNKPMVDAGAVASEIVETNSVVEIQGTSGDLSEFLGDNYKGYDYVYGITEIESNHLYQAEILVTGDTPGKPLLSKMDILLFRPQSPPGSLDFGSMQR